jgi:hypothetical protein
MSKHAIILYYEGLTPSEPLVTHLAECISAACDAELKSIVAKHYDEEDIVKAVGNDAIRKIVFDKKDAKTLDTTIHIKVGPSPNRAKAVKYIKDVLNVSTKEAMRMVDLQVIDIPNKCNVYDFVSGLNNVGTVITDTDETFATAQAGYFVNTKYGDDITQLVKDYALALYHTHVNAADEQEAALVNSVEILQKNGPIAQHIVSAPLLGAIACLMNT